MDGIAQIAGAGRIFIGTTLALLIIGWQSLPSLAAEIEKGVPETPSSAAAVAGTYCCHDGNAYNEHGVTDVSCFQRQPPEDRYIFLSDEQLPVLPPFKAVVEQKQPCAAYLKTADGRWLCIGGPGATPEVAGFVQVLQEGQTYNFPEAFLEYRKRQSEKR